MRKLLAIVALSSALAAAGSAIAATDAAHLSLVRSKSFCATDAYNAYLYVYVTVTNTGGSSGSITVRPWRRYSDGGVNESVLDEFTVNVPAYGTKKIYGKYGYKASEHELRQCGVFMGHAVVPTPLPVENL